MVKLATIQKGACVVHIGVWKTSTVSGWVSKVGGKGTLLIVDAEIENTKNISKFLSTYNNSNYKVKWSAVSDYTGEVLFSRHKGRKDAKDGDSFKHGKLKNNVDLSGTPEHNVNYIDEYIPCDTVDNILKENSINCVDRLYITVVGSELGVLKGAQKSLSFCKSVVVSCTYKDKDTKKSSANEVIAILQNNNFQVDVFCFPSSKKRDGEYIVGCKEIQ